MTLLNSSLFAISIVIPTRDRPGLLADAVASALHALRGIAGEVVVVDDGSVVSPASSLADIQSPKLCIHTNRRSRGASGSRNTGVEHARGELVAFLDDDDLLRPGYLHWILSVASREPTIAYGFSSIRRLTNAIVTPQIDEFRSTLSKPIADLPLRKRLAGLGCGFWVRRSVFLHLGGLDETISVNEDTDFCLALLAQAFVGVYSPEPGVIVRSFTLTCNVNRASVTKTTQYLDRARNFEAILVKHQQYLSQSGLRLHMLLRLLKMAAKEDERGLAAHAISTWGSDNYFVCWLYYYCKLLSGIYEKMRCLR
ncbi:MAG: glycosyltransferase [Cyanobacteria bacterium K_DeepCast_0m_m1_088]|nr:glycosyltransferase [Cyanobacteria bacterium K_DeepCast_0m_m1_088]